MKLLLIDDDRELTAVLTLALERAGFTVAATRDPATALSLVDSTRPDLVVLGLPLRARTALDLLGQLRQRSRAAVIILIGRGNEDERVAGLEQGADDYVSKPFSPRELVARVRALLQHHDPTPAATPAAVLTVGPLTLTAATRSATYQGTPLPLTATEFRLLQELMRYAGTVVTFGDLIHRVWGYDDPSVTDVVRTTVYRLRRKLGEDPAAPGLLRSVPGIGFLLVDPTPPATGDAAPRGG
jgi:two-component system alkaline phosphatase synthesis response regulator PhoP